VFYGCIFIHVDTLDISRPNFSSISWWILIPGTDNFTDFNLLSCKTFMRYSFLIACLNNVFSWWKWIKFNLKLQRKRTKSWFFFLITQCICKVLAHAGLVQVTNQPWSTPLLPLVPVKQTVSRAPTARQPLGAQWLRFLRIRRYARVSYLDPCMVCIFQ